MERNSPTRGLHTLYWIITWISRWMAILACLTLAFMMLCVTIDVAGRNFFNWPLRGTVEIVGLLLIIAATWGLGLCQVEKKHLRISILLDQLPPGVQRWLDVGALMICLAGAGLIAWQTLILAVKYYRMPMGNTSEILDLPFVPFMLALAWGFGWLCIVLLADIVSAFREALKK